MQNGVNAAGLTAPKPVNITQLIASTTIYDVYIRKSLPLIWNYERVRKK